MKNNIITISGHDSAGKTNIAKELTSVSNYQYFKQYRETDRLFNTDNKTYVEAEYLYEFLKQIAVGGIIFDRFMACEYAYAHAYQRPFFEKRFWDIDNKFYELGTKIIYCYKDDLSDYEDELVEKHFIGIVKEYYEEYLSRTKIPFLKLETSDRNLDKQIKTIQLWLEDK